MLVAEFGPSFDCALDIAVTRASEPRMIASDPPVKTAKDFFMDNLDVN